MLDILRNFIIRVIVSGLTIIAILLILPGVGLAEVNLITLMIVAVVFGLVNAILKPIVSLFTCPLVFFTLGLIFVVINVAMLYLTALLSGGQLVIDNFGWGLAGGGLMTVIGLVTERLLSEREHEVRVDKVPDVRSILQAQQAQLDRDFSGGEEPPVVGNDPPRSRPRPRPQPPSAQTAPRDDGDPPANQRDTRRDNRRDNEPPPRPPGVPPSPFD